MQRFDRPTTDAFERLFLFLKRTVRDDRLNENGPDSHLEVAPYANLEFALEDRVGIAVIRPCKACSLSERLVPPRKCRVYDVFTVT